MMMVDGREQYAHLHSVAHRGRVYVCLVPHLRTALHGTDIGKVNTNESDNRSTIYTYM